MKKLILKIKGFIIIAFGGAKRFEKFLAENSDDAIEFVETIKSFVTSKEVITLIKIFPKFEKKAKPFLDKVEAFLNELIERLGLGEICMQKATTAERIDCLVKVIRDAPEPARAKIFQDISTEYLVIKSREYTKDGTEMARSQARAISEMTYLSKKASDAGAKPANVV